MRTSALFLVALICVYANASSFNTQVNDMMMANARASDAVDTVE